MDGLLRAIVGSFLVLALLVGCGGGENSSSSSPVVDAGASEHSLDGSPNVAGSATPLAFTVSGKVTYEDRLYGRNSEGYGFTGITTFKPVRFAVVQLLDQDATVLATARTDGYGNYTIGATASGTARIRVLASTVDGKDIEVEVRNLGGNIFAATKSFPVLSAITTLDLAVPIDRMSGAFNILDVFTAGGEFFHALSNRFAPRLKATWQPGSSNGTYFQSTSEIFVLGGTGMGAGDTDEFDDDVLWHEYGHFLENAVGTFGSRGGPHRLGATNLDLRLAWSEGWSNFISGAMKAWLATEGHSTLSATGTPPSFYLDTVDTRAAIAYDFAEVTSIENRFASNEVAIAKFLWDTHRSFSIAPIWQVFAGQMSSMHPINLEAFWNGWLQSRIPGHEELRSFLAERAIGYAADGREEDDDIPAARPYSADSVPSLYAGDLLAAKDIDIVSFDASAGRTYRIETYDLRNGADTTLTLFSANDPTTPIASNDNHVNSDYFGTSTRQSLNINDGCTLASVIRATIGVSGTYYVEVSRPDRVPLSAGRFGSYKLRITENQPAMCASQ